jgi:hypothetical protein
MLKQRLQPGDEVVSYNTYYQDLPVYLERRITVVNWKGASVRYHDRGHQPMDYRRRRILETLEQSSDVYMLTKRKTFDSTARGRRKNVIACRDRWNVLVVNKEMKP